MPRKRYSTEQIVTKLRQAEVELGRGLRTPEMCKKLGISEQTYYRWRKEYGGLRLDQGGQVTAAYGLHYVRRRKHIQYRFARGTWLCSTRGALLLWHHLGPVG